MTFDIKEILGDVEIPDGFPSTFADDVTKRVSEMVTTAENGIRSAEQKNQKELSDKVELLTAQLADAQSGDSGGSAGKPTTELGKRSAEIKARQDKEAAEAETQRRIKEAVENGQQLILAQIEAKAAGVPQELIDQAGDDAKSLGMAVAMHKHYGGDNKNPDGRSGKLPPSGSTSPSDPPNDTASRVADLVNKMAPIGS